MDSIFGIGLPELVLIAIIAGLVLGPERIVTSARWLGVKVSQANNILRAFVREVSAEVDGIDSSGELKAAVSELQREVNDLRDELMGIATATSAEVKQTIALTEADTIGSIAPPSLWNSKTASTNDTAAVYRPPTLIEPANGSNGANGSHAAAVAAPAPPTAASLPKRRESPDDPE